MAERQEFVGDAVGGDHRDPDRCARSEPRDRVGFDHEDHAIRIGPLAFWRSPHGYTRDGLDARSARRALTVIADDLIDPTLETTIAHAGAGAPIVAGFVHRDVVEVTVPPTLSAPAKDVVWEALVGALGADRVDALGVEATFAEDVVALLRAAWTDVFGAAAGSPAMRLDTPCDALARVIVSAPDGCAPISVTSVGSGAVVVEIGAAFRVELDLSDRASVHRLRRLAALAFGGEVREEGAIPYSRYPRAEDEAELELPAGATIAWVEGDGVARAFEPDWSTARDDRDGVDWAGLVERLGRLEGEEVLLLVDDLGESRVTTIDLARQIEGPEGTFALAIGSTIVTLSAQDVAAAVRRDLGDGFWILQLDVGRVRLLLASPDLMTTDSEDAVRFRDRGT